MAIETELAYLAGIVDGEGSIGAHWRSHSSVNIQVNIQVGMTQVGAVELFVKVFGGHIHIEKRVTKSGKPIYKWRLNCRKAADCLEKLLPYLIIKREQARDAIALARMHRERHLGKGSTPGYSEPIPEEAILARREIANRIYRRNFVSNARCRKWDIDVKKY